MQLMITWKLGQEMAAVYIVYPHSRRDRRYGLRTEIHSLDVSRCDFNGPEDNQNTVNKTRKCKWWSETQDHGRSSWRCVLASDIVIESAIHLVDRNHIHHTFQVYVSSMTIKSAQLIWGIACAIHVVGLA